MQKKQCREVITGLSSQRYLSFADAENYTSLSKNTLARAVKAGHLQAIKLAKGKGGRVIFDREDIDAFLLSMKGGVS